LINFNFFAEPDLSLLLVLLFSEAPNGLRYPRVGGRGQCLRCRKSPKPEKCLKMPQTPTRRVHALLGAFGTQDSLLERSCHYLII